MSKSTYHELYEGAACEAAVRALVLSRGVNAAKLPVDNGYDLVVTREFKKADKVWLVQIKGRFDEPGKSIKQQYNVNGWKQMTYVKSFPVSNYRAAQYANDGGTARFVLCFCTRAAEGDTSMSFIDYLVCLDGQQVSKLIKEDFLKKPTKNSNNAAKENSGSTLYLDLGIFKNEKNGKLHAVAFKNAETKEKTAPKAIIDSAQLSVESIYSADPFKPLKFQ